MLILLSPAKNLDWSAPPADVPRTAPTLAKEAAALAKILKGKSVGQIGALMDLSEKLAALNHARFQAFNAKAAPQEGKQAALAFNGDVYRGLNAKTLKPADWEYAQAHVRILSGLYGLLRPLDCIQPYRLEMGTKLANPRGEDLYDFWGDKIAKALNAQLQAEKDPLVLNLASEEYFSAIDQKALKARIVTPRFLDVKDGQARSVFLFVKQARGLMARHAINTRATDLETLKAFKAGGYRFDASSSTDDDWVFQRKQPPPVAQTRAAEKEMAEKKVGEKKMRRKA